MEDSQWSDPYSGTGYQSICDMRALLLLFYACISQAVEDRSVWSGSCIVRSEEPLVCFVQEVLYKLALRITVSFLGFSLSMKQSSRSLSIYLFNLNFCRSFWDYTVFIFSSIRRKLNKIRMTLPEKFTRLWIHLFSSCNNHRKHGKEVISVSLVVTAKADPRRLPGKMFGHSTEGLCRYENSLVVGIMMTV